MALVGDKEDEKEDGDEDDDEDGKRVEPISMAGVGCRLFEPNTKVPVPTVPYETVMLYFVCMCRKIVEDCSISSATCFDVLAYFI